MSELKPKNKRKNKSAILTERQAEQAEAILDGTTRQAPSNQNVAAVVAAARAGLSESAQIRRTDMLEVIQDAIQMARMAGEPLTMIAGAREIAKMLGFYEPEKKQIELSMSQERTRDKYAALSDEELLNIIEGECTDV
jgi:hypothetical protein